MRMVWRRALALMLAAAMGIFLTGGAIGEEAAAVVEGPVSEIVEGPVPEVGEAELTEDGLPEGLEAEEALAVEDEPAEEMAVESEEATGVARMPDLEDVTLAVGQTVTLSVPVSGTQYKSSNTKIATVGLNSGVLKGVKAGTATIGARVPGYGDIFCKVTVKKAPTKVTLNVTKLSMNAGESYQLTGKLSPSGCYGTVSFSSSNSSVARVSDQGLITAVGAGKATVTVRTNNGKTAKCTVTVTSSVTGIELDRTSAALNVKGKLTLKATLRPAGTTAKLTWKSSSTSVATVTSSGKVTAKKAGTATITVSTPNGLRASCVVTVAAAPTKITLSAKTATIGEGESFTLDTAITPSGAVSELTWRSSNSKVARVSADGTVTGVKAGTATIGVKTANGKSATCKVTVKAAPKKVTVTLSKSTLTVGQTATATANVSGVTWSAEGGAVTVDKKGKITAVKPGEASVWATAEGGSMGGAMITVVAAEEETPSVSAPQDGFIIDISKYQGNVDFDRLQPYVSLVILRATLSMDEDTRFEEYARALNERGIPFGVYCYSKAATASQAKAEAKQLYAVAKSFRPKFYVLDAEYSSLSQACLTAFAKQLRDSGADKVGCYIAHNYYTRLGYATVASQFDFTWIPRYGKNDGTLTNSTLPAYPCDLWQYSDKGKVPGITGYVDMNVITGQGRSLSWFIR